MVAGWTRRRAAGRYEERLRRAIAGRTVLITGASSGIGRALAHHTARAGARLILVARDLPRLDRVLVEVRELGAIASAATADLGDLAQVHELVHAIQREHAAVDVLVNNAGHSIRRSVESSLDRLHDFERLISVNYLGPLTLALGVLPQMLARAHGHIVNVSTIGVQAGAPNFSGYVASKAAMDHFARALALELGSRPIRVTTVHLPLVRTPMLATSSVYEGFPALEAERAARRIGRALIDRPARVAPAWTTGLELLHALAPDAMRVTFALLHDPIHRWIARRRRAPGDARRLSDVP